MHVREKVQAGVSGLSLIWVLITSTSRYSSPVVSHFLHSGISVSNDVFETKGDCEIVGNYESLEHTV